MVPSCGQYDLMARLVRVFVTHIHVIGSLVEAQIVLITSPLDTFMDSGGRYGNIGGQIRSKKISSH